jgi:hypothetical protein
MTDDEIVRLAIRNFREVVRRRGMKIVEAGKLFVAENEALEESCALEALRDSVQEMRATST